MPDRMTDDELREMRGWFENYISGANRVYGLRCLDEIERLKEARDEFARKLIASHEHINKIEPELATAKEEIEEIRASPEYAPWSLVVRLAQRLAKEHYPPDVFTGESYDPGPQLIAALARVVDAARGQEKDGG